MITAGLPKSYTPAAAEPEIRAKWDAADAFHADPAATGGGESFCILIPPPNVTAALHLGHAFNNTLQDVLVRYHRMRGFTTLWMPGTDHAGIATQAVVEKRLMLQGRRRTDFSRSEFVEKVQAWKDEYEATIIEQLKAMGCSCDFARTRFTMDDICARAVREAFFRLFKDGLIYRGKRLVNWDPASQTALADDEVEMEEVQGHMWYLRYPLVHPSQNPNDPLDCQEVTWSELTVRGYPGAEKHDDDEKASLTVATTRPETYLGDTAVAVNPKDPRAGALRGLMVQLPLVGRVIPIIEDSYVVLPRELGGDENDPKSEFATGFLKVTPAHDPNDYEIGQRHNLPLVNVMAPDATISDKHGWTDLGDAKLFVGLSREDARKKVVKEFEARGLLENVRAYVHSVGHSYRSHVPIEPYLSDQWYVKVTDDRMRGSALRAMAPEQVDGGTALTSRDRKGAVTPPNAHPADSNPCAYFISFTCYGNWLHGDDRGSVDRQHNIPGTPFLIGDEQREREEFERLKEPPMSLEDAERRAVQDAIIKVCEHRGWRLIALHVRTKHVHTVVIADATSEKVMNDFKAYATRRLRERGLISEDRRVWTRHGSTRYLNDDSSLIRASTYVVEEQGGVLAPAPIDRRAGDRSATLAEKGAAPLPYGRGSLEHRDGDGELRFYPPRYAKTFQSWHENIRDWCISRQIWWGHRIPVWSKRFQVAYGKIQPSDIANTLKMLSVSSNASFVVTRVGEWRAQKYSFDRDFRFTFAGGDGEYEVFICLVDDGNLSADPERTIRAEPPAVIDVMRNRGFEQDPDVLDTWFSSALWPISTMGWPDPTAYPEMFTSRDRKGAERDRSAQPLPDGRGSFITLLDVFNPSTVLCTAREIITLWVSRMVMFNRYFRDGRLPFRDVYIHAMIQDGFGQKMSKSLGNGVDPRDIIHSHGADALRYVLTQIATNTQDVRLPVDMVCPAPGCNHAFEPKQITSPAGYRVADVEQTCPSCGKKMISAYGAASGLATPSKEIPLARNTSTKFDLGRNFANKLWNATRFALTNLSSNDAHGPPGAQSVGVDTLTLVDKWIISRLHRTLHAVEDALAEYQFSAYADVMYDFVWRDFCDWYLEAIKPTVKQSRAQQQVLRTVLNAILRLLHPIMPFVTEALWPHVQATGEAGLPGIELPRGEVLATAAWPDIKCSVDDKAAAAQFERVQNLVNAIRNLRGERNVPVKKKITLAAPPATMSLIRDAGGVVETLAGLSDVSTVDSAGGRPRGAVPLPFEGVEILLGGLVDEIDVEAEKLRLSKLLDDLTRQQKSLAAKLANQDYVNKAPAKIVDETRSRLADIQAQVAAARAALAALESPDA